MAAADQVFMITELGNLFYVSYDRVQTVLHDNADIITSFKDGSYAVGTLGLYTEHPKDLELFTAIYDEDGESHPVQLYKRYEYRNGILYDTNGPDARELFSSLQVRSFGGYEKKAGSLTAAGPGITILKPDTAGTIELSVYGTMYVVDTVHDIMVLPYNTGKGFQVASEPVPLQAEIEGPSAKCGVFSLELEIPIHLGNSPELELPERRIYGTGPKFWSGSGHEGGCSIYSNTNIDIGYRLDNTITVTTWLGPILFAKNVDMTKDANEQFSIRGDIWYKNLLQDYTVSTHHNSAKVVLTNTTYLVLEPAAGHFTEITGTALEISNLAPYQPYKLYNNSMVIHAGHADNSGRISIQRVQSNLGMATLKLYDGISGSAPAILDRTRMAALYNTNTDMTYDIRAYMPHTKPFLIVPTAKATLVHGDKILNLTGSIPVIPGTAIQTGDQTLDHKHIITHVQKFHDTVLRLQYPHATPEYVEGAPAYIQTVPTTNGTTVPLAARWTGSATIENTHTVGSTDCTAPAPPAGLLHIRIESYNNGIPHSRLLVSPDGDRTAHTYVHTTDRHITEGVKYEYNLSINHTIPVQNKYELVEVQITPVWNTKPGLRDFEPHCRPWYTDGTVSITADASGSK